MKLRVEDMAIAFENKKILEHVSLQVAEGEFVALIGPSGCGKSTLLNILAGVLQAAEGCFYVDDEKKAYPPTLLICHKAIYCSLGIRS